MEQAGAYRGLYETIRTIALDVIAAKPAQDFIRFSDMQWTLSYSLKATPTKLSRAVATLCSTLAKLFSAIGLAQLTNRLMTCAIYPTGTVGRHQV